MKLKIDHEADVLYLVPNNALAAELKKVAPGVIVDCDVLGHAVVIEMLLCVSRGVARVDVQRLVSETVPVTSMAASGKEYGSSGHWRMSKHQGGILDTLVPPGAGE